MFSPGCGGHLTSARYGEVTLKGSSPHQPGLGNGCAPGAFVSGESINMEEASPFAQVIVQSVKAA